MEKQASEAAWVLPNQQAPAVTNRGLPSAATLAILFNLPVGFEEWAERRPLSLLPIGAGKLKVGLQQVLGL